MSPAHVQLTFACTSHHIKGSYTGLASDSVVSKMIKSMSYKNLEILFCLCHLVYIVFYHVLKLLHNFTIKPFC